MPEVNKEFGLKPSDQFESTWMSFYDTLTFPASTLLTDTVISARSATKNPDLRSDTILQDKSLQMNFELAAMSVSYNMEFTQRGSSEPIIYQRYWFEHHSFIQFKINDVTYDYLPLYLFLDHVTVPVDGTNDVTSVKLGSGFYIFKEPIPYPYGGRAEIKLIVATTVTTAATAATNPQVPSALGYTSNRGHYIDVHILGRTARPA